MKKKRQSYVLLLTPLAIFFWLLAKVFPEAAEFFFARVIFRIFAVPLGFLTGLLPFSLGELVLYAVILSSVFFAVRLIYRIIKKRSMQVIKDALYHLAVSGSVLFFLFVVLCGVNYYRYPFIKFCDFEVGKYTEDELYQVCLYLANQCNQTKEEVIEINDRQEVALDNFSKVAQDAKKAYKNLSEEYPVFRYSTGRAKPVLASGFMSFTGIVGIYFPFTMEANVNTDVADYNRPADTCHELAHLHGFMRENEANFISYLACTKSDEAYFRYSGYMMGFIYAANALYEENIEKYEKLYEQLSDKVLADLIFEREYWEELESTDTYEVVETVSDKVNDTYLKVNGQSNGVKSYGEMVDLLIAYILHDEKTIDGTDE